MEQQNQNFEYFLNVPINVIWDFGNYILPNKGAITKHMLYVMVNRDYDIITTYLYVSISRYWNMLEICGFHQCALFASVNNILKN